MYDTEQLEKETVDTRRLGFAVLILESVLSLFLGNTLSIFSPLAQIPTVKGSSTIYLPCHQIQSFSLQFWSCPIRDKISTLQSPVRTSPVWRARQPKSHHTRKNPSATSCSCTCRPASGCAPTTAWSIRLLDRALRSRRRATGLLKWCQRREGGRSR
jgi:hypothetical protein